VSLGGPVTYRGLAEIGRRVGVSRATLLSWHTTGRLLMYKQRCGPRWVWITNEALIFASELARCRAEREARLARQRPSP